MPSRAINLEKIKRAFKAYDVRGRVPEDLDVDLAYQVGLSLCGFLSPNQVAVGRDVRLSSNDITQALIAGLTEAGADVLDLGICGTEQVYFAAFHERLDAGVMVTASHNPPNYNGLKLVRELAKPLSADTGLMQIAELICSNNLPQPASQKAKLVKRIFCLTMPSMFSRSLRMHNLNPIKLFLMRATGWLVIPLIYC